MQIIKRFITTPTRIIRFTYTVSTHSLLLPIQLWRVEDVLRWDRHYLLTTLHRSIFDNHFRESGCWRITTKQYRWQGWSGLVTLLTLIRSCMSFRPSRKVYISTYSPLTTTSLASLLHDPATPAETSWKERKAWRNTSLKKAPDPHSGLKGMLL